MRCKACNTTIHRPVQDFYCSKFCYLYDTDQADPLHNLLVYLRTLCKDAVTHLVDMLYISQLTIERKNNITAPSIPSSFINSARWIEAERQIQQDKKKFTYKKATKADRKAYIKELFKVIKRVARHKLKKITKERGSDIMWLSDKDFHAAMHKDFKAYNSVPQIERHGAWLNEECQVSEYPGNMRRRDPNCQYGYWWCDEFAAPGTVPHPEWQEIKRVVKNWWLIECEKNRLMFGRKKI